MNDTSLSKEVSYILRHAPHEYGLKYNEHGCVDLTELVTALRRKKEFENITESDIEVMINKSEKKRHEINNGKIRAFYGHTFKGKVVKESVMPPDILYHGTSRRFVDSIFKDGLLSKDRQYVHLSEDKKTAVVVGKRRDDNPVILEINAKTAWDNGILFYKGNENIWLSDTILPKFIRKIL